MTNDRSTGHTPEQQAPELAESLLADSNPHHIVAIGASAGGLEALQDFFSNLPADTGAAYVVLQHLSPDFKSVMDQLLGRHTHMPVRTVADEIDVEADHIYLLAPKRHMTIAESRLIPHELPSDQPVHLPVNTFMRSLAADQRMRAIGVILTGTGSDGTQGIKAIHEAGGLVMVQEPESAQFDGMPLSAITTGAVDVVDDLPSLARQLVNYFNQPLISGEGIDFREHLAQHQEQLQDVFELLHQHSGIDFSGYKPTTVARRLEHRMTLRNIDNLIEYLDLLQQDGGTQELENLKRDMLIGVTEFFRDPKAFESLQTEVVRRMILAKDADEQIRIWCIGCSSGEEAYSMAMLFIEEMEHLEQPRDFKVFATDVDRDVINTAALGEYPTTITTEVSERRVQRFFEQVNERTYRIRKFVREHVIFAAHDVLKDPPFSNMDFVVCRNLLIYFQPNGQNKALSLINFSLNMEGFLFLGSAETPATIADYYRIIDYKSRIYQKISDAENLRLLRHKQEHTKPSRTSTPKTTVNWGIRQDKSVLLNAAIDRLFDTYLPPTMVINHNFEVLHSYGDLSAMLQAHQPGRMSDKLRDLLKPNIASYVQSALNKAQKDSAAVLFTDIALRDEESDTAVNFNLRITPFYTGRMTGRNAYAISFETPDKAVSAKPTTAQYYEPEEATRMRLHDLENELEDTRAELKLAHQELDTVREELQSANEELMASNEELQGTNEELQSVNEELYTVNTEYQQKIEELMTANSDVDNFLEATEVAAVFLDSGLRIRRFTPHLADYINMLPVDVGRKFTDLQLPFQVDDIEGKLNNCMATGTKFNEEAETQSGKSLRIELGPYRSAKGDIDGVVLTLLDIGKYRQAR